MNINTYPWLLDALSGYSGRDNCEIKLDNSLRDDLGMDSLDEVQLEMDIESNTGVSIKVGAIESIITVKDLIAFVDGLIVGPRG